MSKDDIPNSQNSNEIRKEVKKRQRSWRFLFTKETRLRLS